MLAGLRAVGLDGVSTPPPVAATDALDTVLAAVGAAHAGFQALYDAIPLDRIAEPAGRPVEHSNETIVGTDGNAIKLHIFRPSDVDAPLPGVVYSHGGGMTILTADNPVHRQWCTDLAAAGSVVIMVDFRNAWTAEAHHPFPAGLEDCFAGAIWAHEHRNELGLSSVVLQGESGGGNLAIATAMLAKKRGHPDVVDGVYASVPYISGAYGWPRERRIAELPSLVENDGYFVETSMMDLLVRAYDPDGAHREDPIAWPYFASEDDVRGLPPFVVSVNELDPLRDEGIAFARTLARAGVEVSARMNLGIVHGSEMIFRHALGPAHESAIRDIVGFAADRSRVARGR
ncbi:alpha/beta hydrolase fold domain-containing protein [Aeromicrobium phragmitis]|nr:alpha/beta hydrolase fold domain-containing protein [Aeromicrobium phragmitis]